MTKARQIPDDEWESHKETIEDLFLKQDKPLKEVIKIMDASYGFDAR
jgi:hypothetical protein